MVSVSSLEVNQEVVGTVVKLLSYGAMIDVGANRLGLLHIKRVADLYGRYIDKEKGLEKAGLERGTKVRLLVESIDKKRLSLDFTIDVKSDGMEEQSQDSSQSSEASTKSSVSNGEHATSVAAAMSAEELAEWAAIASEGEDSQETVAEKDEDEMEDEDDDYDDYDEERDIEDALGLGYY
jgi:predicted RNA-binding protein with RPS1 domain